MTLVQLVVVSFSINVLVVFFLKKLLREGIALLDVNMGNFLVMVIVLLVKSIVEYVMMLILAFSVLKE